MSHVRTLTHTDACNRKTYAFESRNVRIINIGTNELKPLNSRYGLVTISTVFFVVLNKRTYLLTCFVRTKLYALVYSESIHLAELMHILK